MDLEDVGEIIAESKFELDSGRSIQILIGRPQSSPDGPDFYCPYQITGSGDEKVRCSFGVDSIQALTLALYIVDVHLCVNEGDRGGSLNWLGQQISKFPATSSLQDLDPSDDE